MQVYKKNGEYTLAFKKAMYRYYDKWLNIKLKLEPENWYKTPSARKAQIYNDYKTDPDIKDIHCIFRNSSFFTLAFITTEGYKDFFNVSTAYGSYKIPWLDVADIWQEMLHK